MLIHMDKEIRTYVGRYTGTDTHFSRNTLNKPGMCPQLTVLHTWLKIEVHCTPVAQIK